MISGNNRRRLIARLLSARGSLSAKDLAERFAVSRMTIHRDLRALAETGLLQRIHGGAVAAHNPGWLHGADSCHACQEPVLPHQRYLQPDPGGRHTLFCCACCGLKARLLNPAVIDCSATDLISGRSFPAEASYFLIRSSVTPCCQPSILTFADETEARTFRSSFGGVLGRMDEALNFLRTELSLKDLR